MSNAGSTVTNIIKKTTDPLTDIKPPDVSIPQQDLSGINTTFQDATSLLTETIEGGADVVDQGMSYVQRFGTKLAQAGQEALHGGGGYTDDQKGPRAVGPTGDEEADATLLTAGRKRERDMGTAFHSGSGSAGQV